MKTILASIALLLACATANAATIYLQPQPNYPLLGASCGGIHTSTYVTGYDVNGNIKGAVYAWTKCSSGGRGAPAHTYSAWHSIVWNLQGTALVTIPWDGVTPDTAFTETNEAGDVISTSSVGTPYGWAYLGTLTTP